MLLYLVLAAFVAYVVGSRVERVRQAHDNLRSYKARISAMRARERREGGRTLLAIAALLLLLYVIWHV